MQVDVLVLGCCQDELVWPCDIRLDWELVIFLFILIIRSIVSLLISEDFFLCSLLDDLNRGDQTSVSIDEVRDSNLGKNALLSAPVLDLSTIKLLDPS